MSLLSVELGLVGLADCWPVDAFDGWLPAAALDPEVADDGFVEDCEAVGLVADGDIAPVADDGVPAALG
ncbi:MAG: hypothetical protein DMG70_32325 [Acidobacteria bacterium]|nr:MAG: hypothetical protein DMG70_32325 [Acidobacteriota bacterium]